MASESIAYMNIAIIKYWCKDRFVPNLIPLVPSISILSTTMYTKTKITRSSNGKDIVSINGKVLNEDETVKIFKFVDTIVKNRKEAIEISSTNTMPTAAGLASSASGFCALIKEINRYFNLGLSVSEMAKLSTIGSGSAARSFYNLCAFDIDGSIYPLSTNLNFGMVAILISKDKKPISSRNAMKVCKNTSPLIDEWVRSNKGWFSEMKVALKENNFSKIGKLMEQSTEMMHKTMITSNPSFTYLTDESVECISYIKSLREKGISVYYTTDAGPNVKVLYLKEDEERVLEELKRYEGKMIHVV